MRILCFSGGCVAVMGLFLGGCNSGTPYAESSLQETTVKGVIQVHGKPLGGGEVHFNPGNLNRKVGGRNAPIAKDGSYTLTTLVGQNIVSVSPPQNKARSKDIVGLEYEEKTVDLKPGENTQNIDFLP
ncbi:hypothetical protein [Singulisphaera acidiphila]|uniref:Carboxypeptidase regulatory-like domain-containing protein n=1 Tax=Singulisphaera acidiphila (strain ATCC BAA-1392 / DSM 18658 / VKM B-2454 / MOB10) TaxID=886293 RepID=L0DF54_SINAD|nr:hypothetical protein [Singulisphaera acidiphila]AGA27877.1 hypothetical protein Sinac_3628 [Singulisphaera acidiphila DSM 18658]